MSFVHCDRLFHWADTLRPSKETKAMSESSRIPGRPHQEFKLRVLKHLAVRVVLPIAACSLVVGFGPVLARDDEDGRAIGDTRVFATMPFPGHPFGIAVDRDRVYVDTS